MLIRVGLWIVHVCLVHVLLTNESYYCGATFRWDQQKPQLRRLRLHDQEQWVFQYLLKRLQELRARGSIDYTMIA